MKTKSLLISLLTVVALASCNMGSKHVDFMYKKSKAFASYKYKFDFEELEKCYQNITKYFENDNFESMCLELNKLSKMMQDKKDDQIYIEALYYGDVDEKYSNKLIELYNYNAPYNKFVGDLYTKIKNSKYKNQFFVDMDDESIDELINLFNPEASALGAEINDLCNQIEFLTGDYNKYPSLKDYQSAYLDLYVELIGKYKDLALEEGYDSPLQYIYDTEYSHGYDVSLMDEYISSFKSLFGDTYNRINFTPSFDSIKLIDCFLDYSSHYFDTANVGGMKILKSYTQQISKECYQNFDYLFTKGMYFFSDKANSLGTAYIDDGCTEPIAYFSRDCQDLLTIAHEFGHYNAFQVAYDAEFLPYDIYETQSQANEMLLLVYIQDSVNLGWKKKAFDQFVNTSLGKYLRSLLNISQAVEVESYCFANYDKLSKDELLEGVLKITDEYTSKYGLSPIYYTYAGSSPGYYSAYLTSLVAALKCYTIAKVDFSKAVKIYDKIVNIKSCNDVRQTYIDVGLLDIMDRTQVQNLLKTIASYVKI